MKQGNNLIASYLEWQEDNRRLDVYLEEVHEKSKVETTEFVVLNMHKENIPIKTISKCTDLTIDKVKEIIHNK